MKFSSNLLKQFIEDLTEDIETLRTAKKDGNQYNSNAENEIRECLNHILAVMQVFNTVISCLRNPPPSPKTTLDEESLGWLDSVLDCLSLITGIKERETSDQLEEEDDDCGIFDEDIMITGQHAIMMLLEMCPQPTSQNASGSSTPSLYLEKKTQLTSLLDYFLSLFSNFSRQGQICVINFTLQMLNLAAEVGIEGQNQEEIIVQSLSKARITEKAAFSAHNQVCFP